MLHAIRACDEHAGSASTLAHSRCGALAPRAWGDGEGRPVRSGHKPLRLRAEDARDDGAEDRSTLYQRVPLLRRFLHEEARATCARCTVQWLTLHITVPLLVDDQPTASLIDTHTHGGDSCHLGTDPRVPPVCCRPDSGLVRPHAQSVPVPFCDVQRHANVPSVLQKRRNEMRGATSL